jgi:hypothetical protein
MMHDIYGNKGALKLYEQFKAKNYRELAEWLRTRKPRNKNTRDLLRAIAEIFDDTARIDFVSRRPSPDHPYFQELKRRADAAHDLAMSYRRQIEQLKGKR